MKKATEFKQPGGGHSRSGITITNKSLFPFGRNDCSLSADVLQAADEIMAGKGVTSKIVLSK